MAELNVQRPTFHSDSTRFPAGVAAGFVDSTACSSNDVSRPYQEEALAESFLPTLAAISHPPIGVARNFNGVEQTTTLG